MSFVRYVYLFDIIFEDAYSTLYGFRGFTRLINIFIINYEWVLIFEKYDFILF